MALIDTEEAARRLARAIASDLSLYNEEKIVRGIEGGGWQPLRAADQQNPHATFQV